MTQVTHVHNPPTKAVAPLCSIGPVPGPHPPPASQLLIYPLCDLSRERPSHTLFHRGFFLTTGMLRPPA